MFAKELKCLELRRRQLVLQSTLNRLAIEAEMENIQSALAPADRIAGVLCKVRPFLVLLAPVAGILVARGFRNNGFSKVIGLVKWMRPLLALWRQFKSPATDPASEAPTARATGARM